MKKVMISAVLLSGVLVSGVAHADTTGKTDVTSKLTPGGLELTVGKNIDFGESRLSPDVKFAPQTINYTVTDNTGAPKGFMITAKLDEQTDDKRVLDINNVQIKTAETVVLDKATSTNGDNNGQLATTLELVNATKGDYPAEITWSVTSGRPRDISE